MHTMKKQTNKRIRKMKDVPNGMAYKKVTRSVKKVRPSLVLNLRVLFSIFIAVKQNKY